MAKNKTRKNKPVDQAPNRSSSKPGQPETVKADNNAKQKETLYQVKSKKDSGVLKAYITFTYRVLHPNVSTRLVIYGLIIGLPGIFYFKDLFWRIFFTGIGAALILLGFFRQYISLWMTKRNDSDYKNGVEFTYNFYEKDAEFLRYDECFSKLGRYKDISNFYYDDEYYYMIISGRDLFVIPKSAFTIGDAVTFEDFIYKKSKHTCRWIPDSFRGRMKKRRAERAISNEKMMK